jgi:hypothetical protein
MNYHFTKWLMLLGVSMVLEGCITRPVVVAAPPRMCSKPIGTAYVEEESAMERIATQNKFPRQEIERLLLETNCFKLVEGVPSKNDPRLAAIRMMLPDKGKPTGPKVDYRISTSVVFAEAGDNAGYNPYLGYGYHNNSFRADKQNGRATIKLIEEKTDAVITIATGEGVYQDTQWGYMGPATNRSTNRVLEFAFKNAINNLVGQIDHLSPK